MIIVTAEVNRFITIAYLPFGVPAKYIFQFYNSVSIFMSNNTTGFFFSIILNSIYFFHHLKNTIKRKTETDGGGTTKSKSM